MNCLAVVTLEQGLYDEAKMKLDKGMPFALQTNENYVLSQFYLGYGKFYAAKNVSDSANYYFDKAVASAKETPDIRNEFQAYVAEARYRNISQAMKRQCCSEKHFNWLSKQILQRENQKLLNNFPLHILSKKISIHRCSITNCIELPAIRSSPKITVAT